MLYISLIASAVLLVAVNRLAAFRSDAGVAGFLVLFFVIIVLSTPILFLPALACQVVLTSLAAVVWNRLQRGPSSFLKASCAATLAAYGLAGLLVFSSMREYDRLRLMYPYESMEDRVPASKALPGGTPLNEDTIQRLSLMDGALVVGEAILDEKLPRFDIEGIARRDGSTLHQ